MSGFLARRELDGARGNHATAEATMAKHDDFRCGAMHEGWRWCPDRHAAEEAQRGEKGKEGEAKQEDACTSERG